MSQYSAAIASQLTHSSDDLVELIEDPTFVSAGFVYYDSPGLE